MKKIITNIIETAIGIVGVLILWSAVVIGMVLVLPVVIPDYVFRWTRRRLSGRWVIMYGTSGKGSSRSTTSEVLHSNLSPEDTIRWAELEHGARKEYNENYDEIDAAGNRIMVRQWAKQAKKYKDEKINKKGASLLSSGPDESSRLKALPEAREDKESTPEHPDAGETLRPGEVAEETSGGE